MPSAPRLSARLAAPPSSQAVRPPHGIHDFLDAARYKNPPQGQKEVPRSFASEVMISDLLAKAGYNCGYVGKWHMGNDRQPGHGYKYTYTMSGGSGPYTDPEMSLNGETVKEKGYLADLMTQRACEFLDSQSADGSVLPHGGISQSAHALRRPSTEVLRHVCEHSLRSGGRGSRPRQMRFARRRC